MKTEKQLEANRKSTYLWRKNNPKKWQAEKKRNMDVGTYSRKNNNQLWTQEEDEIIMRSDLTHRERAKLLLRSIGAVTARTHKLKIAYPERFKTNVRT